MSDCERYEELISALLDGQLSEKEKAEVRVHMAECPQCRAMYEAFAAVGAALAAEDVPDTLHDGIMAKIHTAEKAKKMQVHRPAAADPRRGSLSRGSGGNGVCPEKHCMDAQQPEGCRRSPGGCALQRRQRFGNGFRRRTAAGG